MGAVKRVKNVHWEKNRRERFNLTFLELSELLPNHDPSLTLTKVDILRRTIAYIKDLRERNVQLTDSHCDDTIKSEIASMKNELSELRQRNRQLAELLRTADISLPPSHPPLLLSPPRKWEGKIISAAGSLDKQDNEHIKDFNAKKASKSKSRFKKKTAKKKTPDKEEQTKARKKTLPERKITKSKESKTSVTAPLREINTTQSNLIGSFPPAVTTVSLVLSNAKNNLMTIAKSNVLTAPIMATGIQPVLQRNPTLSTLGPGTLIMSDGRIVPVPPAQPTMQIFVNRPASQPAVIVMHNVTAVKPTQKNHVRPIVPKPKQRDSTKTTFVNKVPIPAISSHSFVGSKVAAAKNKSPELKIAKKIKKKVGTEDNCKGNPVAKMSKSLDENEVSKQTISGNNSVSLISETNKTDEHLSNTNNSLKTKDQLGKNTLDTKKQSAAKKNNIQSNTDVDSSNKRKKIDDNDVVYDNISEVVDLPESAKGIIKESQESCNKYSMNTDTNVEESNIAISSQKSRDNVTASIAGNISQDIMVQEVVDNNNLTNEHQIENNKERGATEIMAPNTNTTPTNTSHTNNSTISSVNTSDQNNGKEVESDKLTVEATNKTIGNSINGISNKIENVNNMSVQNKCTQISSQKIDCGTRNIEVTTENKSPQNQKKIVTLNDDKPTDKKDNSSNKPLHDETQELTNLFPPDPKMQSCAENIFKDNDFRDRNLFMPISHSYMDEVRLSLPQSDFSNDLFSSLQVPAGGQHPESISPTAAFLLAFPLVSTSKTSELIAEAETNDSQHATPTTILQIGNIEPPGSDLYHQTSLMIENNVTNHCNKNSNTKELKNMEQFNKFQHIEINDLMRNDSFTGNNNCKEKKSLTGITEQNLFVTCNKKKVDGRNCDFTLEPDVTSHFHQKSFEFPSNSPRNNLQNPSSRQVIPNSQKKNPSDHITNLQNSYIPSSQSYTYNTFSSGNEFMLPNSNYLPINQPVSDVTKSQTINLNTVSWSTTATSTTNHAEFTSPYCTYPNKSYTNPPHKNMRSKVQQNNYEEQRIKEKAQTSNNVLPKFSNFQFNNNRPSQESQNYPHPKIVDNTSYKGESKPKKQKTSSQRVPVNWMTAPDIRPPAPEPNSAPILPEVMFQPQKDLDSILLNTSSGITPFNISSSVSNTTQTFYPNSHFSGIDLPLDFAPFQEMNSSTKASRSVSGSQQNPHHYSWSPSKSSMPLLSHIDNQMIPSTLPTLVGDLALGTTTPCGPSDSFRNLSMPITPFNIENPIKKGDVKNGSQKSSSKSPEKECFINSEPRNNTRNVPDYCQKTHAHQSTNTTSSFLSVSQLVDPVKSEQSSSRRSGKQAVVAKNNSNSQKRNVSGHQPDKNNQTKVSNNVSVSVSSNYSMNPRHTDVHNGYQENNGARIGFHNNFNQNAVPPPWQNSKTQRAPSQTKGGSYSAESLIGEHLGPSAQDHNSELPPFSIANQFPSNQYNQPQKSFTETPSTFTAEFPHQNIEFHQSHSHQNCFNFPTQNSHYPSAPFNSENNAEYHIGFDPLYNFNHSLPRNPPCQTSSHKDSRNKRTSSSKRREEFSLSNQPLSQQHAQPQFLQTPQVYPSTSRAKCHPSCPPSSSSTLTNFNLSTIFPEINDKRAVQSSNTFHPTVGVKQSDSTSSRLTHGSRPEYFNPSLAPQMQQVGISPPHFAPVSFSNLPAPTANFRPQ